jgi:hypothetical protein
LKEKIKKKKMKCLIFRVLFVFVMIVKYVRQFPKTPNENSIIEEQAEQKILEKLHLMPMVPKEIPQNDYLYPLVIEITQRYGMVEYESFFSKIKN